MFTGKYIAGNIVMFANIMFLPIDEVMKFALIVCVVIFALIFNLFFFWNKLQEVFLQAVFQKFMLQMYKSEDFVQFLSDRQKRHTVKDKNEN